jgi:hypothetical protein
MIGRPAIPSKEQLNVSQGTRPPNSGGKTIIGEPESAAQSQAHP